MRAVVITGKGGPEVLDVREVDPPVPGFGQVGVAIHAAGLNRADALQARGRYPAPPGSPADIPGLEFAGVVETLGPGLVGPWKPGDRVYGIAGGGGLAQAIVAHERCLAPIPDNLDFVQAAAVPEAFMTAHDALETQARYQPGETVLIHAVGGGVGTAAVQLAHAAGCRTIGTARTAWKLDRAGELGLDVPIDTSVMPDFAAAVKAATGGHGAPVILDFLGGSAWAGNIDALAVRGRMVLIGFLAGPTVEKMNLGALLAKRATIVATTLRARPLEEKIAVTQAFASRVNPWLASGVVKPVVDRVFPLDQAREALAHMESNGGFGKVVLAMR
jgi:putative PIG3 family NAD(P)H quinone oxidoreductase